MMNETLLSQLETNLSNKDTLGFQGTIDAMKIIYEQQTSEEQIVSIHNITSTILFSLKSIDDYPLYNTLIDYFYSTLVSEYDYKTLMLEAMQQAIYFYIDIDMNTTAESLYTISQMDVPQLWKERFIEMFVRLIYTQLYLFDVYKDILPTLSL